MALSPDDQGHKQDSQPSTFLGHTSDYEDNHRRGFGTAMSSTTNSSSVASHEDSIRQPQPMTSATGRNRIQEHQTPTNSIPEPKSKSRAVCRFYTTRKGCRAGLQCPYRHVDLPNTNLSSEQLTSTNDTVDSGSRNDEAARLEDTSSKTSVDQKLLPQRFTTSRVDRRPTVKPVPSIQQTDPRAFQITQVERRFSPERQDNENGTILSFKSSPSDPDFPFALEELECRMTVPKSYPKDGKPTIRVTNADMPRGYQINVERGFDSLINQYPTKTLLSLLNELDKNLEGFLTAEKAQTIKIVANAKPPLPSVVAKPPSPPPPPPEPVKVQSTPISFTPSPVYTPQQKANARAKRDADVRQLEARMNRVPLFGKSGNGTVFTIPVQLPKPGRLPLSLQAVNRITLNVPPLYNLEPCTIKLNGVNGEEAEYVEMIFEKHAREESGLTLMAHINYLTQNMHVMAGQMPQDISSPPLVQAVVPESAQDRGILPPAEEVNKVESSEKVIDEDRPHLKLIPRPPEWDQPQGHSEDDESDSYDSDEDYSDTDEEGGLTLPAESTTTSNPERGILLSFPNLNLQGIELLELSSISLALKCDRCKSSLDAQSIKPNSTRTEICPKCSTILTILYRPLHLHINSIRAGHLDLTGCTPLDLLPSTFIPTCSSCSHAHPTPGLISVRGDTTSNTCRHCHAKQTYSIPEIKFLRLTTPTTSSLPLRAPKPKEQSLGITSGTPLPNNGKCTHYRKSHRWFRFSCCGLVYPCDKCHDAAQSHYAEHATRMICGYCSREQTYRPEECGVCGRNLVGKSKRTKGGFWEGGKGTRDRELMRRKEKRKFKRAAGNAPVGGT